MAGGAAGAPDVGGTGGEQGGAGGGAGTGPTYDGPSPTCSRSGTYEQLWTFDANVENWSASDATLSWSSSVGYSNAGALGVSADLSGGVLSYIASTGGGLGDLSGLMATAHVLLESGTNVAAKLYVRDMSYEWADGGRVALPSGEWVCLSVNVSDPAYWDGVFDATQVRDVGIELQADGAVTVWIDDVGY